MNENKAAGQIQISDEVIAVIATTAAAEVEGVVVNPAKKITFGKKTQTKCVKVTREENCVALELDVVVIFGTKVQMAAEGIQEKVKSAVETMTGLAVTAVDINVTGIVKETVEKAAEEE